ncbi:MAG TPA: efflux RND transporter permease subunit, partial [Myxococcota bacterium]|nr:efflux RND transporter permease subunit [Myxococcota bacterium]
GEDDVDVRVRLQASDRGSREALAGLLVMTRSGPAPLRQVATLVDGTGPATIERSDRQRQITVSANIVGRSLGDVVADIEAGLATLDRPQGYSVDVRGEAERMRESNQAFAVALVLAIIFVYVVLASQFESFVHPVTIMVSLPLAIVGALLGLFLTGWAMGMSSLIGIILLMGLVTKNAILLVDRANQNRDEQGMDIVAAMMEAGPVRLRPILMTSAAMVLGMMPTALSQGPGSEFRAPMAIAVIGGVITSTVLTLVVVPVVYLWFDRFTGRGRRERSTVS